MTDHRQNTGLPPALDRNMRAARRGLWVERIVRGFWPLWCLALLAVALYVLDVFASLPGIWGMVAAGVLGVAALVALIHGMRGLRAPTRAEAMRRLDDSIGSRAVTMLDEDISVGRGNDDAEALWRAHRERVAEQAAAAKAPDADLRLAPFDPWNLRFASVALLLASLGFAQVGGADRIAALLDPTPPAARAATLAPALEAWAAPPPYTGAAPVYLTEKSGEAITVPTGSILTLRASGIGAVPTLTGLSDAGFVEEAAGIWGYTGELTEDAEIAVLFGEVAQADWAFAITPDLPPAVEIAEDPAPTAERELGFSYLGLDDYGIALARATIIADRSGMDSAPDEIDPPIDLELNVFTGYADAPEPVAFEQDFTEHPLAGSPVQMVVTVEDAAEQTGETEVIRFTLPARIFTEPMAKALIEQRRALAWDIRDAWDVLDLLEAVTDYPDDYFTDPKAQLATSSAMRRLTYALEQDRVGDERAEILDLLWRAALRLEEGDLSDELEQLRAAQRRLQDALERGASDEEIERLMDELRQAMRDYIDEMVRQAQRDQQNGEQQQGQQGQQEQTLSRDDLERMLQEMEEAAKSGSREQAEQMLSALSQMLENLQMGQSQSGQGGEQGQQEQALQDMMRRQQELADETFRQLQEGENGEQGQNSPGQGQNGEQQQPGQGQGQGEQGQGQQPGQQGQGQGQGNQPGQNGEGGPTPGQRPGQGEPQFGQNGQPGGRGLSGQQEGLRDELGNLIPNVPEGGTAQGALGEAERDMQSARDRLSEGDLNSALDDQARALDRLREGAQALAEENQQQAQEGQQGEGQQSGQGNSAEGQNPGELDPFGRLGRTFGPDDGEGVEVPGERARNRAQEIQREIRRRQGERARPEEEREYLDRLQDRF